MAAIKYDIAEPLLSDEEPNARFVSKCPSSSCRHRRLPPQKLAIIIHALMFLATLLLAGTTIYLNAKHVPTHCKSDLVPPHSKQPFLPCEISNMLKPAALRPYCKSNQIYNAVNSCESLDQRTSLGRAEPRSRNCMEQRVGR